MERARRRHREVAAEEGRALVKVAFWFGRFGRVPGCGSGLWFRVVVPGCGSGLWFRVVVVPGSETGTRVSTRVCLLAKACGLHQRTTGVFAPRPHFAGLETGRPSRLSHSSGGLTRTLWVFLVGVPSFSAAHCRRANELGSARAGARMRSHRSRSWRGPLATLTSPASLDTDFDFAKSMSRDWDRMLMHPLPFARR